MAAASAAPERAEGVCWCADLMSMVVKCVAEHCRLPMHIQIMIGRDSYALLRCSHLVISRCSGYFYIPCPLNTRLTIPGVAVCVVLLLVVLLLVALSQYCLLTCGITAHPDCCLQYAFVRAHVYFVVGLTVSYATAALLRVRVVMQRVGLLVRGVATGAIRDANV